MNPYISAPKNLLYFSLFSSIFFFLLLQSAEYLCLLSISTVPFSLGFIFFKIFLKKLKIFSWILFYTFLKIFFSRLQILKLRNYIVILLRIFNHIFIVVLRICDII